MLMRTLTWCIVVTVLSSVVDCVAADKQESQAATVRSLLLTRTIPLPGVDGPVDKSGVRGRVDHLAYDTATKHLFVACIANGSLEVVDLDSGKRIRSIGGLKKPQGVVIMNRLGLAAVSTGGDGVLRFFDTGSFQEKASPPVGEDADNVRIAPNGRIYVGFGGDEGAGGLAEFDPAKLTRTGTIRLPRRPESFHFDPSGVCVFVNHPGQKRGKADGTVVAVELPSGKIQWSSRLRGIARNFPMALDSANHRIFIGSRLPPKLIMLDDRNGAKLAETPCPPDCDDVFFDSRARCILVIGGGNSANGAGGNGGDGAGSALALFAVDSRGSLERISTIPLPPHARTGLFVPERQAVYVAVPPLSPPSCEIREYKWP